MGGMRPNYQHLCQDLDGKPIRCSAQDSAAAEHLKGFSIDLVVLMSDTLKTGQEESPACAGHCLKLSAQDANSAFHECYCGADAPASCSRCLASACPAPPTAPLPAPQEWPVPPSPPARGRCTVLWLFTSAGSSQRCSADNHSKPHAIVSVKLSPAAWSIVTLPRASLPYHACMRALL